MLTLCLTHLLLHPYDVTVTHITYRRGAKHQRVKGAIFALINKFYKYSEKCITQYFELTNTIMSSNYLYLMITTSFLILL